VMTDASNRIRELREALNLTQQSLADQMGVSQSQIDRLEKGQRKLTQDWVFRFARIFQVDPMLIRRGPVRANLDQIVSEAFPQDGNIASEGRLPILKAIRGRTNDYFVLLDRTEGYAPRPPGLATNQTVRVFRMPNETMAPRWRQGELVFFDPASQPIDGEHAIIFGPQPLGTDRVVVFSRLIMLERGEAALDFYSEPDAIADVEISRIQDLSKVKAVCRVFEWSELIMPDNASLNPKKG
jgi:transcriptional regulator with XRE-family HTH domain